MISALLVCFYIKRFNRIHGPFKLGEKECTMFYVVLHKLFFIYEGKQDATQDGTLI